MTSNPTALTTELSPAASTKLQVRRRERMSLITSEGNSQVAREPRFSIHKTYMVQFLIRLGWWFFLQKTGDSTGGEGSAGWVSCVTVVCPSSASRARTSSALLGRASSGLHTKDRNQGAG